jgi:hypothetical protein
VPNSLRRRPKHGMTWNKKELFAYQNILFETHTAVYERSSSFEIFKFVTHQSPKHGMTWPIRWTKVNCLHIKTSILRPIWKFMRVLAAVDWVTWLEKVPLLDNNLVFKLPNIRLTKHQGPNHNMEWHNPGGQRRTACTSQHPFWDPDGSLWEV